MSLLLEALKKAERIKRESVPAASSPGDGMELEAPLASAPERPPEHPGETMPPEESGESSFPEISLAELEVDAPPAPRPETARAANVAEETPLAPAEPAEPAPVEEAATNGSSGSRQAPLPLDLEARDKTEPVLSLDFPEPSPLPPPASAPEPEADANPAKTDSPPPIPQKTTPEAEPRPPHPAPAAQRRSPAAKTPSIPVPEYAPAGAAALSQEQEAAKKILSARQGAPKRNLKLLAGILIVSIAAGAIAAYYYWQAVSQPAVAFRPQPPEAEPDVMPPPAPQPSAEEAAKETDADPQTQPPATVADEAQAAADKPAAKAPAEEAKPAGAGGLPNAPQSAGELQPAAEKPLKKKAPPVETQDAAAPAPMPAAAPASAAASAPISASTPDGGIRIRRDAGSAKLDPLLASAYQAFMAGDSGKAENDYRKALRQTPNSRDALLGLAAIAASRGQAEEAATHYLRVLQLDPKDAAAQAGLIGLKGYTDPVSSESRLKTLLSQTPDAGYLHFALGNLYAHQSRWSEAQEAYFNALHADSGNADYAFNLAVSLDHLDQRKPALVYYQRALSLLKERSAGFDGAQVQKRIHELQAN